MSPTHNTNTYTHGSKQPRQNRNLNTRTLSKVKGPLSRKIRCWFFLPQISKLQGSPIQTCPANTCTYMFQPLKTHHGVWVFPAQAAAPLSFIALRCQCNWLSAGPGGRTLCYVASWIVGYFVGEKIHPALLRNQKRKSSQLCMWCVLLMSNSDLCSLARVRHWQ